MPQIAQVNLDLQNLSGGGGGVRGGEELAVGGSMPWTSLEMSSFFVISNSRLWLYQLKVMVKVNISVHLSQESQWLYN